MKKWIYILFILFSVVNLQAQVNFKARVSRNKLSTDERLTVKFSISADGMNINQRNFTPPSFKGFQKVMGPSTSQEYSFINGRSSAKVSFSYVLQPLKTGKLTIGSASITVDGQKYTTQPIEITITKGSGKTKTPQNYGGVNPNNSPKTGNITVKDKVQGAFLVADVSKTNPYVNEAVGLTYKLYIPENYSVVNYNETEQPQYNGFWVQDINKNISGPFQGEIKGKPYIYYVLRKKLLFPQHAGKLTVKPLTLQIDVQVPVYRNFFGMRVPDYEIQRVKLTSGKKVVNVKELPAEGQPVDFSGAVGNFDFSVTTENNQVAVGNPVNVQVRVKGKGNLKLFDLPKLKAPDGLEVYDPKHTEHIQATFTGNKGTVQDEYIIIPNAPGKYIIPAMRFVYFDPQTKSYVSKTSGDIVLFVTGNGQQSSASNTTTTPSANYNAADFRFIKEKADFQNKNQEKFYGSKLYKWLLSVPFILALLVFGYYKYQSNKVYDADLERSKKRKSLASKFLKEAKKNLGDKEKFYAGLEKALYNFLKAHLHIDTAEMSRENIRKKLEEKNIDNQQIEGIMDLLNRCDMARYAPASNSKMEVDLKDAERVMNSF